MYSIDFILYRNLFKAVNMYWFNIVSDLYSVCSFSLVCVCICAIVYVFNLILYLYLFAFVWCFPLYTYQSKCEICMCLYFVIAVCMYFHEIVHFD